MVRLLSRRRREDRAAAKVLEQIATYLSIQGENLYRVRAYQEAGPTFG